MWLCCCVAPRVFRAPEGPAAREARRPHFVRRRASKPARALRSLRRPPHQWCQVAVNSSARPRHRPWVSQPVPSGPSGALHTGGAGSLMCALRVDSLSGQAPPLPINFARNSPAACSNIECTSLELQRFWGISKNDHDKLRAKFGRRWCRCCPWAPQPGPVGQTACLSETAVAFAGAGRASTETAIAFAGAKWVFLARFSAALVLVVSMVAVQGCAVVMVASCWPVSVAVEVSLVASSPRGCALCVKKFALRGLLVATAVESSPCMRKTR